MAAYSGFKDASCVFVDAINIAPVMDSLSMKKSAVLDERRFLGNAWPTQCDTGARHGELSMSGVLNSPTSDTIATLSTGTSIVSALIAGNLVDMPFHGFQAAKVTGVEATLSQDKVQEFTPEFTVTGRVNYGVVVAPYVNRVAAANTDATWASRSDPTSASGYAFMHVGTYTGGATKVVVKVRTSATHGSFADLATFLDVTAVGAQVLTIPSGILEHLSISWAWTGGTTPAFDAFVGVAVD